MATEPMYDRAIAYATAEGETAGRNAAEWYTQDSIGGRVTGDVRPAARAILRGIEDGDPMVTDTFPHADLSGQWADTLTGPQLTDDALTAAGIVHAGERYSRPMGHAPGACDVCDAWDAPGEIADAYELAFATAAEDAIAAACRAVLPCDICGAEREPGEHCARCGNRYADAY